MNDPFIYRADNARAFAFGWQGVTASFISTCNLRMRPQLGTPSFDSMMAREIHLPLTFSSSSKSNQMQPYWLHNSRSMQSKTHHDCDLLESFVPRMRVGEVCLIRALSPWMTNTEYRYVFRYCTYSTPLYHSYGTLRGWTDCSLPL